MDRWRDNTLSVAVLVLSSATLKIAASLHPSATGVGTHVQLGLPSCRFLALTGIPCPSCGLTTSFAYAAHLDFRHALLASPFGLLLFFVVVSAIPTAIVFLWSRLSWQRVIAAPGVQTTTYMMIAAYLASWIYKIAATGNFHGLLLATR
jgi:hypothetical protein